MAVPVSAVKRKNPSNPDAPAKWYAHAQANGVADFDSLCRIAAKGRTVTQADISAALYAVVEVMEDLLVEGRIVRLGNFGSFQVVVSSNAAVSEEAFNVSLVRGAKLAFRPGPALAQQIANLSYTHVPQLPVKKKPAEV